MLLREVNTLTYNAVFQCLRGTKQLGANIPRIATVRCNTTDPAEGKVYRPDWDVASAKPFEAIPHFRMIPFIGTVWTYFPIIGRHKLREQHLAIKDKQEILGDIYREKSGPKNYVWINTPQDAQVLFKNEGSHPSRGGFTSLKLYRDSRKDWYTSAGVLVLQGKEWRALRAKVQQHLMNPLAVHAYLSPLQDVARDFVDKIYRIRDDKNEVPKFMDELYKWALESVAYIGMDTRLGCLDLYSPPDSDGMQMIKAVQTMFKCMGVFESDEGVLKLWKYIPTPIWRKFTASADIFTVIAFKHLNNAFKKMKETVDEGGDPTLLQAMLMTKGLEPSEAMVTVADLVMGGIDTSSHAVGFFLYHMARNPEKQELVHQEIVRLLPKKEDRITTPVYGELRYLKACVKESQRLNPLFSGIIRKLDHDVVFSGYRVPAETLIVMSIYAMCTDERYFTDPKKFLPERWLSKDEKFHPFAFLPFGYGTRSCLGRRVAELEITCVLAELIRNFRIEYRYEDIGMYFRMVNSPNKPLRFNFIERQQ